MHAYKHKIDQKQPRVT